MLVIAVSDISTDVSVASKVSIWVMTSAPTTNADTIPFGLKVKLPSASETTYSNAALPSFSALLITRALIPSTALPSDGEYTPFAFAMVQFLSTERNTITEFFTFVSVLQNGHVDCCRASNELRSISPLPPVHALASFSGSLPENENFHELFATSISTKRSLPGQLESYTSTRITPLSSGLIAYGSTACPPLSL